MDYLQTPTWRTTVTPLYKHDFMNVCKRHHVLRPHWRVIKYVLHDDVIKWKHFPRYWAFVRGIHRSLVNSPHKGQWRGAVIFSLICAWRNGLVNNRYVGALRRHHGHYDVTVMEISKSDMYPTRVIITSHVISGLSCIPPWAQRTFYYMD